MNVPRLVRFLGDYNPLEDWYLGKPSIQAPLEIVNKDKTSVSRALHTKFITVSCFVRWTVHWLQRHSMVVKLFYRYCFPYQRAVKSNFILNIFILGNFIVSYYCNYLLDSRKLHGLIHRLRLTNGCL